LLAYEFDNLRHLVIAFFRSALTSVWLGRTDGFYYFVWVTSAWVAKSNILNVCVFLPLDFDDERVALKEVFILARKNSSVRSRLSIFLDVVFPSASFIFARLIDK